ncbi:MAG: bifunctional phosphoribosylaminoimidazolecarboxamide formyltransferase/IMP cyclohydrolase [Candidatus Gottesmanbacteria bacterium]|nr:bifunctional phosphoribosylaminoimidazolecarboxamide formyltransferase/IMP cyclohydrolase [Candidatus Gottesmanbacteria bacterium]
MIKHYALLSVFDKTGIEDFSMKLIAAGYTIISTGGTGKRLTQSHIPFVPIEQITGNPESFDGRMKTISFQVESGILFDRAKRTHQKEAKRFHIVPIDVVVCNLYPFEQTVAKRGVTLPHAIENIDVGGPTMIRAGAKNFRFVLVVVDPADYAKVSEMLQKKHMDVDQRQEFAAKAFSHLSLYDAQVARFLNKETFPGELTIPLRKHKTLRYGDNPDQSAVWYVEPGVDATISHLELRAGRNLSATNMTDIDAGIKSVRLFGTPAAVVIKHNSPCGIGLGNTAHRALSLALASDSESAFGGVVVMNVPMTARAAGVLADFKDEGRGMMDIVAVPDITGEALAVLTRVRKSTGVYVFGNMTAHSPNKRLVRWVDGGMIIQNENNPEESFKTWKVVTEVKPTKRQLSQMKIIWKAIARIRSNTVAVMDSTLPIVRGIGAGQTSRVLSTKIALERAGKYARGGILASDSFFPFDDSVSLAAKAGIVAIVQQGGSVRDQASIDAANASGITMVFTGQRVFWH